MTGMKLGRRDALRLGGAAGVAGLSMLAGKGEIVTLAIADETGAAPLNVQIVNTSGNTTMVFQYLLKQKGYLEKFGLKATLLNVSDGNKITSSLLSGDVDVCMMSGFSSLLPAIEKGARMKVLCGAGTLVDQSLYSKKPDVHTMKDLVGRTVGVGAIGALLHEFTVAMLRKHGIDETKVTFVNIGSSADVFKAVLAGTVDAGPAEIDVFADQAQLGFHVLPDSNCWEQIPEYTWQAGYAADRAIAEKRPQLVRTLAAFGTLYRFVTGPNSWDDFRKARAAVFNKDDEAAAKSYWDFVQKYKGYASNLVLSQDQIDYVQKLNLSLGVQKKLLPYDQVADMSVARDALKLMGPA